MNDLTTSESTNKVRLRTYPEPTDIAFHGQSITTFNDNGVVRVAMKPVCEGIGLNWRAQYNRMKRHPVLSPTVVMMTTVAADGKQRPATTLPLSKLNGWLFGVDASRVRPEVRERLIEYQAECFDVLADYWNVGASINPRVADATIGATGFDVLQNLIGRRIARVPRPAHRQARAYLWNMLHDRFNVRRAEQIRADDLDTACAFVAGCSLEGEFLPRQPAEACTPDDLLRAALGPSISRLADPKAEGRQRWLVSLETSGTVRINPLDPFTALVQPDAEAEMRTIMDEYVPYYMLPTMITIASQRLGRIAGHMVSRR